MPKWKMTPANRAIAERVLNGESPTVIARELDTPNRSRVYKIFYAYCEVHLFPSEYDKAKKSGNQIKMLKYYLKAKNVYS